LEKGVESSLCSGAWQQVDCNLVAVLRAGGLPIVHELGVQETLEHLADRRAL
jgi:hypothetical protein